MTSPFERAIGVSWVFLSARAPTMGDLMDARWPSKVSSASGGMSYPMSPTTHMEILFSTAARSWAS